MWIVMTSAAKMPATVHARYRNVALVKLTDEYAAAGLLPKMISSHARGVLEIRHLGHHHVGKTAKAAYQTALAEAEREAAVLNGGGK